MRQSKNYKKITGTKGQMMKLIYHQEKGKITNRNREDDWLVELGGKEYHIVLTPLCLIVINSDGETLRFDINGN